MFIAGGGIPFQNQRWTPYEKKNVRKIFSRRLYAVTASATRRCYMHPFLPLVFRFPRNVCRLFSVGGGCRHGYLSDADQQG